MYVKSAGGNIEANLPAYIETHIGLFSTDRLHRIMIVLSDLANDMKTSSNVRLSFEIAMAKIANPKSDLSLEALAERISNLENAKPVEVSETPVAPAHVKIEEEIVEFQPEAVAEEVQQQEPAVEITQPIVNSVQHKNEVREIPKKVVNVVDDKSPAQTAEIKMPERPVAVDFTSARENLRQQANLVNPTETQGKNLNSNTELQKL